MTANTLEPLYSAKELSIEKVQKTFNSVSELVNLYSRFNAMLLQTSWRPFGDPSILRRLNKDKTNEVIEKSRYINDKISNIYWDLLYIQQEIKKLDVAIVCKESRFE